jgi:gliding motility-associated-like protein
MFQKFIKISLTVNLILFFASVHAQTTTYGDTIFFEDFGIHTTRVECQYMPPGSYTFADPTGDETHKEINDNYYAIIDPIHIADANQTNYYWTSTNPNSLTPRGAKYYTTDHTSLALGKDIGGAVMVLNAGTIQNFFYHRDTVLKTGFRYLLSFYIYVINQSSQFSMQAINTTTKGANIMKGPVITQEGKWIKYDLNFSVPISNTDSFNVVSIGLRNELQLIMGNDYYVDDILLTTLHTNSLKLQISNDGPVCNGGIVHLKVDSLGDAVPFTFHWKGPNGFSSAEEYPALLNFKPEMAGMYTLIATDALGQVDSASTTVTISPLPKIDFTMSKNEIDNRNNTVTFTISTENKVNYAWDLGDGSVIVNQSTFNHSFDINGTTNEYKVSLTAVDSVGCSATTSKTIEVIPFIPNVFSPNGDGMNDVFMKGFELTIYDRNGLVIFKGNNGWDGTYHGKTADNDVYFYQLSFLNINNQVETKKGYITLVR